MYRSKPKNLKIMLSLARTMFDFPNNAHYQEDDKGTTMKFNLAGTKKSDVGIDLEDGRYISVKSNGPRRYVALVPKDVDIELSLIHI